MNIDAKSSSSGFQFAPHDLVPDAAREAITDRVLYEKRPARRPDGSVAEGLFNAWITLNNPSQFNSYTTDMVKGCHPGVSSGFQFT